MNNCHLNVVYIGMTSFPLGPATSKRRRYMVDYMNNNGIQSHYLVCDFKQRGSRQNAVSGVYGRCDYLDITPFANGKRYISFWREGKRQLEAWYVAGKQNVLIFETLLSPFEYPFYRYARKLGYKIVFDQVETSYFYSGNMSFSRKLNIMLSEIFSDKAYKKSAAFVISKNLWNENHNKYPNRKLCILPNSTPQLGSEARKKLDVPLKVLYAGTYAPKDGVKYLLDGVIKAHEKGCKLELLLLGKGKASNMTILDIAKDKDYVKYVGFVSDEELNKYLLYSDVLCMTRTNSRFANYGFPFKLSEYLATGNIILATNVGDVSEYIKDGESAYIVTPEDSDAIADAICRIVNNQEEALTVAKGGLEAMQAYFSIEKVGEIFIDFLKSL